ncbi:hypothetical protein RchiOBHm_Chr7g0238401 [Rosa chinensis]|uniref:Uncharacterized protein n=1 Tax=Rosa chinensis TaxID=74649 RepID=A0A2P6PHF6_ROSCH|nr:hypothetical protein RchiOBHm_Chr7g0238401 [Rosa chinensis]
MTTVLERRGFFQRSGTTVVGKLGSFRRSDLVVVELRGSFRQLSLASFGGVFAGFVQIIHPLVVIMLVVSRSSPLVVSILVVSRSKGLCSSSYYVISYSCQLDQKIFKSNNSSHNSSHPISHTNSHPSTTDFLGVSHGYLYKVKITYQAEYGCSRMGWFSSGSLGSGREVMVCVRVR